MPTLMELFLGVEEQESILPIHVPLPSPAPSPSKAGIMETARLPVDRFLVYAEEGDGLGPCAIAIKK